MEDEFDHPSDDRLMDPWEDEQRSEAGAESPGEGKRFDEAQVDIPQEDEQLSGELRHFRMSVERIKEQIGRVIVGQEQMIELMLAGIFSGGHVLLEGVPGVAKTLAAKLLARTLSVGFSRIQFTPDLMPSDVIGTSVFNVKNSDFEFKPGPVFSNVVLIDEINRSPAKTQAALFEVMEERTITVDGHTHTLPPPFFVIATQNPIEQEGTYRLPEAQLDRFMFRIKIAYPSLEEEQQILRRFRDRPSLPVEPDIDPVLDAAAIAACMKAVDSVHVSDGLCDYIARIVHDTRHSGSLYLGASPRASLAIMRTSKAWAVMNGRDFVIPEDVQFMVYPVLNHRMLLAPERELEGADTERVIREIVQEIDVPR